MSAQKTPVRYTLYPALKRFPDRTYAIICPALLQAKYDDENHASVQVRLDLRLNQPFSVLPPALFANDEIDFRAIAGITATWRGISCQVGYVTLQIRAENLAGSRVIDGLVRVLLPAVDPPGPPLEHILIGVDYLEARNASIEVSYVDMLENALNHHPCGHFETR